MYEQVMARHDFVLGAGSMSDRLNRDPAVRLDPGILHASLIYDDAARDVLDRVSREYINIGQRHRVPMIVTSPTWRASGRAISRSPFAGMDVNGDGVAFMRDLRAGYGPDAAPIVVGGQCGPMGDAYKPGEAPDTAGAERFHREQIEALAAGGPDFLIASTLPAFPEALGIAALMADTGLPYVLSFVARADGCLLDGTPLGEVIRRIDDASARPPAAIGMNCVHASVFSAALRRLLDAAPACAGRILGLRANTSARTPEELDGLAELETEAPEDFAASMAALHDGFGTVFLGGCCGTSTAHIEALARRIAG